MWGGMGAGLPASRPTTERCKILRDGMREGGVGWEQASPLADLQQRDVRSDGMG